MLTAILPQEKLAAVKGYKKGRETITSLAKRFHVSGASILKWINKYEAFGENVFTMKSRTKYPEEIKRQVIYAYLFEGASRKKIAVSFKIHSTSLIDYWIKQYNDHNRLITDLKVRRRTVMAKGRETTFEERVDIVQHYLSAKCSYKELAEKYNIAYHQANSYIKKYREGGMDALIDRRGKRKEYSEMSEIERLRAENRLLKAEKLHAEMEASFLKKLAEVERRWK